MKTLTLTFTERLFLNGLMSKEDSITNLICRKQILERTDLVEKDFVANKFELINDQTKWVDNKETIVVEISEMEVLYLKEKLVEASNKKKLSNHLIDVYQEIV